MTPEKLLVAQRNSKDVQPTNTTIDEQYNAKSVERVEESPAGTYAASRLAAVVSPLTFYGIIKPECHTNWFFLIFC